MNIYQKSICNLIIWNTQNGWDGFDPYDIIGSVPYMKVQKNKVIHYPFGLFINYFPRFSRISFNIKPRVNAKAMALFARAYLNLFRSSGKEIHLENAEYCLNWLIDHPSSCYSGYCWGYPFDWQG